MSFRPDLLKKIVTKAHAEKTANIYAASSQLRQKKISQRLSMSQNRLKKRLSRRASQSPANKKSNAAANPHELLCIHTLFELVDKNSDGQVTKTELLTAVMRRRMREPKLDLAFQTLGEMFPQANKLFKPKSAKKAIRSMNTDNDNILTENEMLKYCLGTAVVSDSNTLSSNVCKKGQLWLFKQGIKKCENLLARARATPEIEGTRILETAKVIKLLSKCNRAPVTEVEFCQLIGDSVLTIDNVIAWIFNEKNNSKTNENEEKNETKKQVNQIDLKQIKLRRLNSKRRKGIGNPSKVFKDCDKNGSGTLEPNEVQTALRSLGNDMDDVEFQRIFAKADKNKDGSLSLVEFQKILYYSIIFTALDADCTGYLDKNEIRESFTVLFKRVLSDEDFVKIYSKMDKNGDGEVEFKEFKNFFAKHQKMKSKLYKQVNVDEAKVAI